MLAHSTAMAVPRIHCYLFQRPTGTLEHGIGGNTHSHNATAQHGLPHVCRCLRIIGDGGRFGRKFGAVACEPWSYTPQYRSASFRALGKLPHELRGSMVMCAGLPFLGVATLWALSWLRSAAASVCLAVKRCWRARGHVGPGRMASAALLPQRRPWHSVSG